MPKKIVWLSLILVLVAGLGWQHRVVSQPDPSFGPWVETPEFTAATGLMNRDRGAALEKFAELAEQNPRTRLGAVSLLSAAGMSGPGNHTPGVGANGIPTRLSSVPPGNSSALYEKLARDYAGTHYEIIARERLLDRPGRVSPQDYVTGMESLLQSLGAPSVAEVVRDRAGALERVRSLPYEARTGALYLYDRLGGGYAGLNRDAETWALTMLGEQTGAPGASIKSLLRLRYNLSWGPVPRTSPTVRLLKPKNQAGPRQRIVVEISNGNFKQPQVDIPKLKFVLDGRDRASQVQIRMKIDKQMRENRIFQTLRLRYRPDFPLAAGSHTLNIYAPTRGYQLKGPGATNVTYSFNVRSREERDDDRDEADDCDFE